MARIYFESDNCVHQTIGSDFHLFGIRAEESFGGAGLERRSVSLAFPAARSKWTGSGLEHGGRRSRCVCLNHAASALGSLQAALRAGYESANRPFARGARHVAGGLSAPWCADFFSAA